MVDRNLLLGIVGDREADTSIGDVLCFREKREGKQIWKTIYALEESILNLTQIIYNLI